MLKGWWWWRMWQQWPLVMMMSRWQCNNDYVLLCEFVSIIVKTPPTTILLGASQALRASQEPVQYFFLPNNKMIMWGKIQFTGFKIFWISVGHHFGCYHDSGGHDADGHDDGDDDHDDHIQILAHLSPSSLSWLSLRQGRVARTAGRRTRTNPPRIWANQNIVIIWPPHTPNPPKRIPTCILPCQPSLLAS